MFNKFLACVQEMNLFYTIVRFVAKMCRFKFRKGSNFVKSVLKVLLKSYENLSFNNLLNLIKFNFGSPNESFT